MTEWMWDRFARTADIRGDSLALCHGDQSIRFAALRRAAETIAAEVSLAPGDRVVISAANSIGFAATVLAIWRRGAIPVVIHPDASTTHLEHCITETEAAVVFAAFGPKARPLPRPDATAPGAEADLPPHGATAESDASVIFTSGSTGPPKGIVQRSASLIDGAERIATALGLSAADRILCPVPFSFDYGWGQLLSLVVMGIPLVLPEPRTAAGLCAALQQHRPTVLAGVPAVMADLCFGLSPIRETATDSIRLITNTGSRLSDAVFDEMRRHFPQAELSLNYGLTETYRSAMLPQAEALTMRHSVGPAVPGAELVILRDDGSRADPGEIGEILHVGAGTFDRYWRAPEKTAETRIDWQGRPAVRTGDYGALDDRGYLTFEGRRDRQIKCMGVRLSLDEVEAALAGAPQLRDVAVVSQPHDILGALITAFVVAEDDDLEEKALRREVNRFARANLSPFMQPRAIIRLASLPRNVNGKVDYPALTAQAG